ncbi:succinylglutamate desuccinylase/aspartoacylase family protein [Inhella gelatinilytica]|uniref:Succinylglutamate desuccinylase/aspartoacylase family protein n=1 Tax=Inhella gelatinilytica TaxID=2795030 RepID=A0A931IVQ2_9BURK|nr:succinylglutamate desuccinylase/aspartoacylase family protein [Inhella gelatinilytica]MBH9552807.1 succinylglutamate desuccinylase/aspartoacylase family protein [Inhella gelatinilytica]
MERQTHVLQGSTVGTQRSVQSLHFGAGSRRVYIQASLHADEIPAMLVAHHLRQRLTVLEQQGQLQAEVVLVTAANPLGLSQQILGKHQGRFEWDSGHNFNRHYPDLVEPALARARASGELGADAAANTALLRRCMQEALAQVQPRNELASLRHTLLGLALSAEVVLDLHCDNEGVMHLYSTPEQSGMAAQLGQCLRAEVALLANESGDSPFDEACSTAWPRLQRALAPDHPLQLGCFAATVEHRGVCDVTHEWAAQDAEGLLQFLGLQGLIVGMTPPPDHGCALRPLAGSLPVAAPHAGVVVFLSDLGGAVSAGECLAELIDPVSGESTRLLSPVDGLYYRREQQRWVQAGQTVFQVAGAEAQRVGKLLSA